MPGLLDLIARVPGVGMTPSAPSARGPMAPAPQSRVVAPRVTAPRRRGALERLLSVPTAYRGLLTDEDAGSARGDALLAFGTSLLDASGPVVGGPAPSLGQALSRGVQAGMGAFQQGIAGAAGRNLQTVELTEQLDQQARQQAFRQRAAQLITPGMPPEQQFAAWQQLAADAAAAGVDLGPISQIINATRPPTPPKPAAPQEIRVGNEVLLRDPLSGKIVDRYPIGPSPRDPNAPDTAQQLRDQRMFQREQQLADDFHAEVKGDVALVRKLQGALNELPAARNGDGAAQVNMLYAFVSAMDPASAVREGEIGLAQSAASLRARAQQLIQKYTTSGSAAVPDDMLRMMGGLLQRRASMARDYVGAQEQMYRQRGASWGVRPDVFRAVGVPPTRPASTTAPSTGSNPLLR